MSDKRDSSEINVGKIKKNLQNLKQKPKDKELTQ